MVKCVIKIAAAPTRFFLFYFSDFGIYYVALRAWEPNDRILNIYKYILCICIAIRTQVHSISCHTHIWINTTIAAGIYGYVFIIIIGMVYIFF